MRRSVVVAALVAAIVLVRAGIAPGAVTTPISGSGSGVAELMFASSSCPHRDAFGVETGTYTSMGPLGHGTYRRDSCGLSVSVGTKTFTRSDGATLSGTYTASAPPVPLPGPVPFTASADLADGTGGLVDAHLDLRGVLEASVPVDEVLQGTSTFTFTGTVTANVTPPSNDACKNGGWHDFVTTTATRSTIRVSA